VLENTREDRLLVGAGGLYGSAIRISTPLNIAKSDVDEVLRLLGASLESV
jgi:4-aminobutyrate aminotransferase-like enzyme